eukprot:124925_1
MGNLNTPDSMVMLIFPEMLYLKYRKHSETLNDNYSQVMQQRLAEFYHKSFPTNARSLLWGHTCRIMNSVHTDYRSWNDWTWFQYDATLSKFIDSTQTNGQIECEILLSGNYLQMKVIYNFYTQITMITEVNVRGYKPINVSIVHIKANKSMFAFNREINNDKISTQWIEIKLKYNNNLKFSFDIRTIITKI